MSAASGTERDGASRIPLLSFVAAVLALTVLVSAACGGGSNDEDHDVQTPVPTGAPFPVVVSRDMEVGSNRFVLGLLDQSDNSQILGADLHLRFFLLEGSDRTLKTEADPQALRVTKTYTHTHADGTVETHEAGETGAYVTQVTFDTAGDWGVEVTGTDSGGEALEAVGASFDVLQESAGLDVGDDAPRSVQSVLSDVGDISEIDTSLNPIPEEHDKTIAAAVTSGRPTVIVFATPAFCTSQICGPTKDNVDQLYQQYGSRANFVHVEPYDLVKARAGDGLTPLPLLTNEWGLSTEPWVFIVDSRGKIAAKFDGIVSYEELESALTPTLG